ncbi:Tyrosine-protein kinase baz1b [Cichlidogyrus casuarinus]|uniref:Tyrosine-protein kinase baz1b n=1 Tax=Cichlidogyrus casuarinus TaxID=1844966 RepID=A0ABD2QL53_9PLAT
MSFAEKTEYLRNKRKEEHRVVNDEDLADDLNHRLPSPNPIQMPDHVSHKAFGKLLNVAEFLQNFQSISTQLENSGKFTLLGEVQTDYKLKLTENQYEEEATLIAADAPLPETMLKSLRHMSMDQLLSAVSDVCMSSDKYRTFSLVLVLLLRMILKDITLSQKKELGLDISSLPVTPSTAPEMLRLILNFYRRSGWFSSSAQVHMRANQISVDEVIDQEIDVLSELLQRVDFDALTVDQRIMALEILVDRLMDLDLIDDFIETCHHRQTEANKNLLTVRKKFEYFNPADKKKLETGGQQTLDDIIELPDVQEEEEDLASIVKKRRMLASKVAEQRDRKRRKEEILREKRLHEQKEERLYNMAVNECDYARLQARFSCRAYLLGQDRNFHRYWFFRCAPDRLFVEMNWAPPMIEYHSKQAVQSDQMIALPEMALGTEYNETVLQSLFCESLYSKWAVLDSIPQLEALKKGLHPRGERESALKHSLARFGLLDAIIQRLKDKTVPIINKESFTPQ